MSVKKDGSPVLQTYNWAWLKVAHLRDGAESASRPRPGRPSNATAQSESSTSTGGPKPTSGAASSQSKQPVDDAFANTASDNHETSYQERPGPPSSSAQGGIFQNRLNSRPIRSTRNLNPNYVNALMSS